MKNNKFILFEEIKSIHRWAIPFYLLFEYKVYYVRLHMKCANKNWVNTLKQQNKIYEIDNDKFWSSDYFNGYNYDLAFDNMDHFFVEFQNSRVIKYLKKIIKNDAVELIFKKQLVHELARFYYLNSFLHKIQNHFAEFKIVFIPTNGIQRLRTEGCEISDYKLYSTIALRNQAFFLDTSKIKFSKLSIIISFIKLFRRKSSSLLLVLAPVGLILKNKLRWFNRGEKTFNNHYKFGIMILEPFYKTENSNQRVDFLIDEKFIFKKDCLFLSKISLITLIKTI